jgi:DDE domain
MGSLSSGSGRGGGSPRPERFVSEDAERAAGGEMACFIIVCQNTAISKLVYDFMSGFHRKNADGTTTLENGRLELFRNFDETTGNPMPRPNTLLIDSEQLEAGDALDDNFRGMAADEIDRFRREIIERTGDAHAGENISDGLVTRTVARIRLTGKMAHDHLVCPPPVPPEIIRHAVCLYVRFTLSYRDVEDLLAERGLDVSYETVRRWVLKFGPLFARELRRQRPRPTSTWHLDEMAVVIAGRQFWLWRAVDDEGEVLDLLERSAFGSTRIRHS